MYAQIFLFTHMKCDLKRVTYLSSAPVLFSQYLILTVHNPVKQLWETVLSVFTRIVACENRKNGSFQGVFSTTLHPTPVPLACYMLKFYFDPWSYVYVYTPDTGPKGRL